MRLREFDLVEELLKIVDRQVEDDLGYSVKFLAREVGEHESRVRRFVKSMDAAGLVRLVKLPSVPVLVRRVER